MLNLLWKLLNAIGHIFVVVKNGQTWKNYIGIWSHWQQPKPVPEKTTKQRDENVTKQNWLLLQNPSKFTRLVTVGRVERE